MNGAAKKLLAAWRGLKLKKPPFILNGDQILIERKLCHPYRTYRNYIRDPNFGSISPHKFHTGLLPVPYSGDILRAKIYILALNPGFGPLDYYAETYDADLRGAKVRAIRQKKFDSCYPWHALNPRYCWSGGGRYWIGRLEQIATTLMDRRHFSFADALHVLSTTVACLEYVPYHSKSYGLAKTVARQMRSPKLMLDFVHNYVVPKARQGAAVVIVTRHVDLWGLPSHRNIIAYNGTEARAAYLNLKSRGGRKIAEILGL